MAKINYVVQAIPSSFVFSDMKLRTDKGAGEAKLFVGPKSKENEIDDFFQFDSEITYRFDKRNMLEYLLQVKMEYAFQNVNQYKDASVEKWNEIYTVISDMSESDFIVELDKYVDNARYYVRSDDEVFKKIFRKMVVPKLTDLVITKDDEANEILLTLNVNYNYTKKAEEDCEERNKRLFRYWLSLQLKPEGDSDAGEPYTPASIEQYVSNVANTPLDSMPDKSVFYTTDVGAVQSTLEVLNNSERKNNTQRSAIKKYMEYLNNLVSDEDCEEVFNHRLFGMHIKEKNNALSIDNPHVCIGWSVMGDLSDVSSKDELAARYDECFDKKPHGKGQDIGQIWRFLNDMQIGDYVIFAESSKFHIGRVESDYFYDDSENVEQSLDYKSTRSVRWLKKNISRSVLSSNLHRSLMTAMSIFSLGDYKSVVSDLLRGTYVKDDDRTEEEEENMDLIYNTTVKTKYERNRIVFGAPGTGKSYKLKADCEEVMNSFGGSFERVTFHPEYSYSQFVGTYKPVMGEDGESIKYSYVPGPFMRIYVEALKSGRTENPQPHLLLIEEINRAKVAAVFGDVFQLLDRDDDGVSEYEIQASEDIRKYLAKELGGEPNSYKRIRIPNNMFIWSTMNSADQGVFPMDTAFKRRWNFEYLGINENEEEIKGIGKVILGDNEQIEWNRLRKAINAKMSSNDFKINEDKLMGPFFLSKKAIASDENGMIIDKEKFVDVFKSKVIMYLYEDAVKQGKHRFFDGCKDTGKYSSVCEAFDTLGIGIFGTAFKEIFYDKED